MLQFPANPTNKQQYSLNGRSWEWDSDKGAWLLIPVSSSDADIAAESAATCLVLKNQTVDAAALASESALLVGNAVAGFFTHYLGAFVVAPTTDNSGSPLKSGALYFNTLPVGSGGGMKVYSLSTGTWVDSYVPVLGYIPANKAGDTFTGAVLTTNAGGFTANSAAKLWTDSGRGRIDLWEGSGQTKSLLLLNTNAGGRIGMTSNEPLEFVTSNTAHLFLTAAGFFGIGKPVPSGPLHIKGANGIYVEGAVSTNTGRMVMTGGANEILAVGLNGVYVNGRVKIGAGAITPANGGWIDSFADGQHLFYGPSSVENARLTAAGFLGLGTATPSHRLTIQGAVDTYAQIASTGVDTIAGVVLLNDARSWVLRNTGTNGDAFEIRDATANAQRFSIDALGNHITSVTNTAAALSVNNTLTFSLVNNSTLRVSVRGTDGVTRTGTLSLT
jgi:hypothetical protein